MDDSLLLAGIVRAVLANDGGTGWTVDVRDFWCVVTPPGAGPRRQGWKLHVSATQLAAPVVLDRAARVCVAAGCAFKFARGLAEVAELLSNRSDRHEGGKFITVYPADDAQFRRLAADLDAATDGLPGPVILSDRRLRPGSLVHYRYGAFAAEPVLTNDGSFETRLAEPDGLRVPDVRRAWFTPPAWTVSPWGPAPPARPAVPEAVLIGDRLEIRRAIRHSYRGGVFRATDRHTGDEVVVKQARAHVQSSLAGTDARDTLRHEAAVLDRLGPTGLAPRTVALVSHQDDLFLAEELVPGATLRLWAAGRALSTWRGQGAPFAEAVDLARQLAEMVATVHAHGLVLRDLNPNNIMVTPEGRLRLVDLEHVVAEDVRVARAYTVGYAAPEVMSAPPFGPAPSPRSDLFSLGTTILYLASAVDPVLPADIPADRPVGVRLRELVDLLGRHMEAVRRLAPLVLGLTLDDPRARWSLTRARDFLSRAPTVERGRRPPPVVPGPLTDRLVADGLRFLVDTMTPTDGRLWPATGFAATTDPGNVQHGAAGVLGVLTRAAGQLGHDHLRDAVARVAAWIDRRLFDTPRFLPGLYFGRSGTAWSLYDAARLLGDDAMAARAVELAGRLPVRWPNPDVCHGAAGAGLALLHLWAGTGDPELSHRGMLVADGLLAAACQRDGQWLWPIPADFESALAGLVHYGFAHGVAGIGTFLLYAGVAAGREDCVDAARRAGDTLEAVAMVEDGAAWWPSGEGGGNGGGPDGLGGGKIADRTRHWCSGSSGVGTFLVRLWAVTGERRFLGLATAAGAAVRRDRWLAGTSACHGLAGDGDFLLDLADLTGDERYREWAGELAEVMQARNAIRRGLMVIPDESGRTVSAGYNTGLGGAVGFLLRLRHGGPRWWLPDMVLTRDDASVATG